MSNTDNKFLREIDKAIVFCENQECSSEEIGKVVKSLIKNIFLFKEIPFEVKEHRNPLFDDTISIYDKNFIAVCLLRLWSSTNAFFEREIDFQRKTIKLIEELIENDNRRFKDLNLKANDQTFIKVNILKDFVRQYEETLFSSLAYEVKDIDSIDVLKKKYLRTIRNNTFNQFILPFLPKDVQNKIDLIFSKVNNYTTSGSDVKSYAFDDLINDLSAFVADCQSFNTRYCDKVVVSLFAKIEEVIKKDFLSSPYSKPADLQLIPINKKYPFGQTDASFKIGFELRNVGDGYAYNTEVIIDDFTSDASYEENRMVGTLALNTTIIEFKCKINTPAPDVIVALTVKWKNFNKQHSAKIFEFILPGQRNDINWDELKLRDFYSVEAVETQDELVGRREILNLLTSRIEGKKVSSAYIYGQRRVGKSSIVKTLKTELESKYPQDIIVYYSETGDYKDPNSNRTVDQLATSICKRVKNFDRRISHIPFPEFRGALSPITTYFNDITEVLPNCKILIILDEFDKIPSELYRKGDIGDSFFDTIRAISNKGPYGFLLVGGERMEFIMRDQSQEVNKFKSIRVDYFDKSNNWSDFKDLVTKPIEGLFEITEEAINYIYDLTSGNPFFTKVICEEMVRLMISNRDSFITKENAIIGGERALDETSEQTFAHFWKDGIRDVLVNEEEVASNRRKVLIALTSVQQTGQSAVFENVIDEAVRNGLAETTAMATLNEFIDRGVLILDSNTVKAKVNFFGNWLTKYGIDKLRTTLVENDRIEQEKIINERSKVKSQELVELTEIWGTYRGSQITTDKVRSWLEQFGEERNQRLMFKILQNLRFYSDFELKIKLREIFQLIRKDIADAGNVRVVKGKESTRKDIIVSYLEDSPAKSGAEYAKLFADENKIFHKNVMSSEKLEKYISSNSTAHSVIFIDDFIGSGNSAFQYFAELHSNFPNLFTNPNLKIYFGVVCGFQDAKQRLLNRLKRQHINISVHICDLLDESDKVFNDSSKVFTLPAERHLARTLCYNFGCDLVKNNALGYGDCQAIVVFPRTIPNNSLPILWAVSNTWRPLFERPL